MKYLRTRSAGVRHPVRNAVISGLVTLAAVVLVVLGAADMRSTGRSGSPLLVLGLLPALLGPIFLVHYLGKIRAFADLRTGRRAIARWILTPAQFGRFCREEDSIPDRSIMANFYKPPSTTPDDGLEVIFGEEGVLLGGGYFPLSVADGRRVQSVRYIPSDPPTIEFGLVMETRARTSGATIETRRIAQSLRVPVAPDAEAQATRVIRHYQARVAAG